jgi:hypothetical protein
MRIERHVDGMFGAGEDRHVAAWSSTKDVQPIDEEEFEADGSSVIRLTEAGAVLPCSFGGKSLRAA